MRSNINTKEASFGKTTIGDNIRKALSSLSEDQISFAIDNGFVNLKGTVNFEYERRQVEVAIEKIKGVKGVVNNVTVKPLMVTAADIKKKIATEFHRQASADSSNINVDIVLYKVRLTGKVRSWTERRDAENVAWSMPGIIEVQNDLEVGEGTYVGE